MVKIALTNQKGGVAKTTTAFSIAAALANKGKKVLCIDADPQENLSIAAGIDLSKVDPEILGPDFMVGLVKLLADIDITEVDLDEVDLKKYPKAVRERLAYVRDIIPQLEKQQEEQYNRKRSGKFPGEYPTLDHVLRGDAKAKEAVIEVRKNLSVIVSGIDLVDAEVHLSAKRQPSIVMRDALKPLEKDYDYCIIDCSPAIGRLLMNVLAYTDYVIIPIEPALYATLGIYRLYQEIFAVREINPNLKVLGWLLTKVKKNTSNTNAWVNVIEERANFLGARVFDNIISQRVAIEESQSATMDIYEYAKKGGVNRNAKDAAKEYLDVVDEMLRLIKKEG